MLIPENHKINLQLKQIYKTAKVLIFAGLPGTGKSLFINHTYQLTKACGLNTQLIQWDVARKEFEKGHLIHIFPTKEGQVHAGLRLCAGVWLMQYLKNWIKEQKNKSSILLIEAPLIGNRFSELAHKNQDPELEQMLCSPSIQFILPVPSEEVRSKIETERKNQVSESAKVWSGAKPSVMLRLWKDTLKIANELQISNTQDDAYRPDIYAECYEYILRHRRCNTLAVNEIFEVPITNEKSLHSLQNELPAHLIVEQAVNHITQTYSSEDQMNKQIESWHKT